MGKRGGERGGGVMMATPLSYYSHIPLMHTPNPPQDPCYLPGTGAGSSGRENDLCSHEEWGLGLPPELPPGCLLDVAHGGGGEGLSGSRCCNP